MLCFTRQRYQCPLYPQLHCETYISIQTYIAPSGTINTYYHNTDIVNWSLIFASKENNLLWMVERGNSKVLTKDMYISDWLVDYYQLLIVILLIANSYIIDLKYGNYLLIVCCIVNRTCLDHLGDLRYYLKEQ